MIDPDNEAIEMLQQLRKDYMTDEEATEMLKQLSKHYRDPVMTLSQFCSTMQKWARCIVEANEEAHQYQHGKDYAGQVNHILTDIAKSDLLGRMFYLGEEPRTEKCPLHKGHWSGLEHYENVCPHGCGLCGWLPNKMKQSNE